jgi:imidazolonepropionase-like amidohydrolase
MARCLRLVAPLVLLAVACSSAPPVRRPQQDAPSPPDAPRPPERVVAPASAIVFEGVSLVPMDREGVLRDQTVVVADGRVHAIAPASSVEVPASATRIDARGKFLLPGLADMHAHAVDDEALFLYLAAGVTQLRVTGTSAQAIAQRDRVAAGELIGPSILVEEQIAEPSLTREQYDLLVAGAHKAGRRVVGQVPETVGLAHALASHQSSIEHLGGYNLHLSDPNAYASKRRYWQSTPGDVAGFVASFQFIDETHLEDVAKLTREAGTWNCPTLVLHDHAMRAGDPRARASVRGARYLGPERKTSGVPAAWPAVATARYQMEGMRRARPKLLALVRALDAAGAGLLVGTGSGTPGLVPGFAVLDEIVLLVEAGVTPWRALRAATSGAASYLGQEETWGSIAVGRRADLLLVDGDPTADLRALGSRLGVMVRGRWFPASELEGELARLAAYADGTRSRLAEAPAIPVDGTREEAARFVMQRAGEYIGEQRLVIDRRADGTRVITAEILAESGLERVRVEVKGGLGSAVRHESARGVLELRRAKRTFAATFTPAGGGAPLTGTFDLPRGALFNLPPVAGDHLFYPAAMKLRPGEQVTVQLVHVVAGGKLIAGPAILRLLRQSDRKDAPGQRFFSVAFTARNQTVKGGLILDKDGRLIEESYLDNTIRRAD